MTSFVHRLLIDPSGPAEVDGLAMYAAHPVLAVADAHRRRRGPYTGGGDLLRQIVPALLPAHRDLLQAHDVEIRAVAPELREVLPGTRETLTSLASTEERTRFYPGAYTLRVAHGLADLLAELAAVLGPRTGQGCTTREPTSSRPPGSSPGGLARFRTTASAAPTPAGPGSPRCTAPSSTA